MHMLLGKGVLADARRVTALNVGEHPGPPTQIPSTLKSRELCPAGGREIVRETGSKRGPQPAVTGGDAMESMRRGA